MTTADSQGAAPSARKPRDATVAVDVAVACLWTPGTGGPEVLLTRRSPNVHLPGCWELPGGKLEPGETVEAATRREAVEELALAVDGARPVACVEHRYPSRTVRLHIAVAALRHRPALDGIEHRWVPVGALDQVDLPPANRHVNEALRAWFADPAHRTA